MIIDNCLKKKLPFKVLDLPSELPEFGGISYNSLKTLKGDIFFAVKGLASDGHDFIEQAQKKGAVAVVCEKYIEKLNIPQIIVSDSRRALSWFSACFYDFPSKDLNIIGVTGTNGKTTICSIIEAMLASSGKKPGVIGTIDTHYTTKDNNLKSFENLNTTPESAELHKIIYEMKQNNITDIIMEVSSHAISLGRVDDIDFNTIVFSNLTQDHLDFHKTMEDYSKTKAGFIKSRALGFEKSAPVSSVINVDDNLGRKIFLELSEKNADVLGYSITENSDLQAFDIKSSPGNTKALIKFQNKEIELSSKLTGVHNVENILAAAGASVFSGILPEKALEALCDVEPVSGRLEQVSNSIRPYIFVDYAHTPDALKNVLHALKNLGFKKIICIFGCGGDRDSGKRPVMGSIAGELADISIITSDNPRTEEPEKIIRDIEKGILKKAVKKDFTDPFIKGEKIYFLEKDRRRAIRKGLKLSEPEDCILIAGKGHEKYQIIGTQKFFFDDRKTSLEEVANV